MNDPKVNVKVNLKLISSYFFMVLLFVNQIIIYANK